MDHELQGLLDASREDAASEMRRLARLEREVSAADASFGGALLDLAERGALVAVVSASGRRYRGTLELVGEGVIRLRGPAAIVLLRTAVAVETAQGVLPTGRRQPPPRTLADELSPLLEAAPEAELVLGRSAVRGALEAMGQDVLTVRTASGELCHVRLDAVDDVVLRSG